MVPVPSSYSGLGNGKGPRDTCGGDIDTSQGYQMSKQNRFIELDLLLISSLVITCQEGH
jgi:hypothetical protein